MADFYTLAFISTIDFDKMPGQTFRGEYYKDDILGAQYALYPALLKTMLEDTFFSIASESRYAFDRLISDPKYIKDKSLPAWVIRLGKDARKKFGKVGIGYSTDDNERIERFKFIEQQIKKYNITKSEFVSLCNKLFNTEALWENKEFGGKAWANICSLWLEANNEFQKIQSKASKEGYNTSELNKLAYYIDRIYDLEHNNGTIFNKLTKYGDEIDFDYYNFDWIKHYLDYKATVKNPYSLLNIASDSMKKLAQPVLKAAGYNPETADKNELYHISYKAEPDTEFAKLKQINPNYVQEYWTNKKGQYHRDGDKPAFCLHLQGTDCAPGVEPGYFIYYKNGLPSRDPNIGPALIRIYYNNKGELIRRDTNRVNDMPATDRNLLFWRKFKLVNGKWVPYLEFYEKSIDGKSEYSYRYTNLKSGETITGSATSIYDKSIPENY